MIYTKRFIYSLSLIISIFIYFLTCLFVIKIQTNLILFEKSQTISLEDLKNNQNEKEVLEEKVNTIGQKQTTIDKKDEEIRSNWNIKIPTINLDAPISEGVSDDIIAETVGHFEESSRWNGNVALAAHNRGYKCNYFQEIKNLKNGDIIIYSTTERNKKIQS